MIQSFLIHTVKGGREKVMVWECDRLCFTLLFALIESRMDIKRYLNLLKNKMLPSNEKELPVRRLQQNNDTKRRFNFAQFLNNKGMKLLSDDIFKNIEEDLKNISKDFSLNLENLLLVKILFLKFFYGINRLSE